MKLRFPLFLALAVSAATLARADEGMWLYSAPPREAIKAKYGFELTDAWLDHLMKSSVRFNSGGSGSFVSADGLVITNHHVGSDDLQKLSSEEHNYLKEGFYAATPAEEKKCVDLELNVLQSIEDVTARVTAAVPAGATGETAAKARRAAFAEIEKESREKTGLRSDVVTLYQGGAYHLYRFKRYTDIRLVFAPEQQVAFFGGDPDNFEYPRYNLDICLFRVYENGQPAKIKDYLKFSAAGTKEGDLTFVSGHPGRTERQFTSAELAMVRDTQYPYAIDRLKRMEVLLSSWGERSLENARRARDLLFGVQNSRKAYDGMQAGLYTPAIMDQKAAAERAFQEQMRVRPEGAAVLKAYEQIAAAVEAQAKLYRRYRLLEGGHAVMSDSFEIARELLRAGDERVKPNGERLREYSDARKEPFELQLFSDKPIYTDLEIVTLADALTLFAQNVGAADPLLKQVLAGKSPRERAAELINGTQVRDVAFRRKLYEGGAAAVKAANDPMIEVARLLDSEARTLRKAWEAQDETRQQAHSAIEKAHFALEGPTRAPDATFTLRLSYGPVKGYEEAGKVVPPYTQMGGLFARSEAQQGREPFDLPARWLEKKGAIDPTTPFNFVNTADIIGGNSGSPVVNTAGEFVGIIFDGNIQSLVLNFAYEDRQARALSVDCRAILESMRKVYGVDALVNELVKGTR
ncbi:S46 family peptidase [Opitutus sp. ER46]|uniref:S46 family peptidase n=1 Tax=Opitutus sp. ER46 TaxID=2161864 RepID=UPI000D323FF9|nr:S46 family peptidase [Opitutus sp. ER46]PTX95653.1 serine protease [Opitutus sp. ER46]